MSPATALFSAADVISTYTRANAIADGVLIDLSERCPDVCRQHVGPVQIDCTAAVWRIIERAVQNPRWANDTDGIVHDILWMARAKIQGLMHRYVGSTALFEVIIRGAAPKQTFTFKVGTSLDAAQRPCLTIMLPDED
jgi:hypothetical protein